MHPCCPYSSSEGSGPSHPASSQSKSARSRNTGTPDQPPLTGQIWPAARARPDFASIHQQLREHKHLTLQLLWEEYRQANPDGYRYSRYCYLYQRWRSKLDVALRQEHKAGEKMFVDWAGATIPVYDRHTGIAWHAPLFVAALGASSYTWAEATRNQQMEAWLQCHVDAFELFTASSVGGSR